MASDRLPPNLIRVDHPVVEHALALVRDRRTTHAHFRELMIQLGMLLAYEATRDLPTHAVKLRTPLEATGGALLDEPITITPILRAGLVMAEGVHRLLPDAHVGHIGMFRNEDSLRPVSYYDKLPKRIRSGPVLLVDPMLATGGSAMAAANLLASRGCRDIRLLCVIASPEGLERFGHEFPDVPIYVAAVDRQLDERGYILPGLGDAGDRLFGTTD